MSTAMSPPDPEQVIEDYIGTRYAKRKELEGVEAKQEVRRAFFAWGEIRRRLRAADAISDAASITSPMDDAPEAERGPQGISDEGLVHEGNRGAIGRAIGEALPGEDVEVEIGRQTSAFYAVMKAYAEAGAMFVGKKVTAVVSDDRGIRLILDGNAEDPVWLMEAPWPAHDPRRDPGNPPEGT